MVKNEKPDALKPYRDKRSAGATGEPFGAPAKNRPHGTGVFVTHKHAARRLHWDLRLEIDGVLRSWAVPHGPSLDPNDKRLAVMTEDHPLEYVDYEGVIPEGNYGAGAMILWDRGRWVALEPIEPGFEKGKLLFELHGHKLRGVWTLVRTKRGSGNEWLLIKKPDGAAVAGQPAFDEASILSGLTVEELKAGSERVLELQASLQTVDAPERDVALDGFKVMLAESRPRPFSDPKWLFEIKYDGYRVVSKRSGDRVRLQLRSGNDTTEAFPEIVRTLGGLPVRDFIIDGEVVVLDDDGRPNFSRLAQRAKLSRVRDIDRAVLENPVVYYAFDLIALDGYDLRKLPLHRRKHLLRQLIPGSGPVRFSDHIEREGEALFQQIEALGVEGIVAKKRDSHYRSKRDPAWQKIRSEKTDDFIIVGFTEPDGSRHGLGAVHLATNVGDQLVYCGRAGSGFSDSELTDVRALLEPDRRDKPPCIGDSIPRRRKDRWVEPRYVCEVRYHSVTEDHHLRFPVWLRLRDDKGPDECRMGPPSAPPEAHDTPPADEGTKEVVVSNRNKLFWADEGYTKGDLLDYYEAIGPWILPYLQDRLLVLTRYPDGIQGKSFYQRNAPPFVPKWLRLETRWSEDAEREVEYFVCDDVESLLYVANMGTIPLHVWGSRIASLQTPDWCILDLDPKEAPFSDVVTIARKLHELCDEIGLPAYPKTSGSTGMHVLIPLGRQVTFDQSRQLAHLLSRIVTDELPDIATIDRVMKKRQGRVYIDFLQNGHGRVLVSPYCVRPVAGALVSTPLTWREVTAKLDYGKFDIKSVPKRMRRRKTDPMRAVLDDKPDLHSALGRLSERMG